MRNLKTIAALGAGAVLLASCNRDRNAAPTGSPFPPGATQRVHLVWKPTNEWMVKLNGGSEQNPKAAKTTLTRGTGPTMFIVDIQGSTNAKFKNAGALAVWVGDKLQPQQGINSDQILGPVVSTDGKKLIFIDLNRGSGVMLNYELHFDIGPKVDPIIDNGGGNWL